MPVQNKENVAELWLGRLLRAYPGQSEDFLATERDPFRNPAGSTFRQAIGILLDEVLLGMDPNRVTPALDSIVQIRALQGVDPSHALEFLFQLKELLRPQLLGADRELIEGRIDQMALLAFDLYMKYRERTYQAKTNEARRRVFVMERRMKPVESAAELMEWQERGGI